MRPSHLLPVLALALVACSPQAASTPETETSVAAAADAGETASVPAPGAELGVEEFAAAIQQPGTMVLDVRTQAEYDSGHLPGAINVDATAPDFADRLTHLDQDVPYAVYCASGNRSAAAMEHMLDSGFDETFHLAGGITAWRAEGGAVVGE